MCPTLSLFLNQFNQCFNRYKINKSCLLNKTTKKLWLTSNSKTKISKMCSLATHLHQLSKKTLHKTTVTWAAMVGLSVLTLIENIMLKTCVWIAITNAVNPKWQPNASIRTNPTTRTVCAKTAIWPSTTKRERRSFRIKRTYNLTQINRLK